MTTRYAPKPRRAPKPTQRGGPAGPIPQSVLEVPPKTEEMCAIWHCHVKSADGPGFFCRGHAEQIRARDLGHLHILELSAVLASWVPPTRNPRRIDLEDRVNRLRGSDDCNVAILLEYIDLLEAERAK